MSERSYKDPEWTISRKMQISTRALPAEPAVWAETTASFHLLSSSPARTNNRLTKPALNALSNWK